MKITTQLYAQKIRGFYFKPFKFEYGKIHEFYTILTNLKTKETYLK